ncbi:hypothetical protein J40TS1_39550 [Paenibacillus montaniterrae]|uniref:GNAT-like C-terminal domain-containing protein n=1 Tax=Paenibacillus montaniterrae TaxID=429341 RepID=A0A919YQP7_9BACL|nr:acyltransferase domain-containing protein [Paenibacillus montaniterrae]GIP18313.1 hypothetical protein J40TS1_39550 [Paenibacillus montaniterrae]
MISRKPDYEHCIAHCQFDYVPEGLEQRYQSYEPGSDRQFISRSFLESVFTKYAVPEFARRELLQSIEEIEKDDILLLFSQFLIEQMCTARENCDEIDYRPMQPQCMEKGERYTFLLLLACIEPSQRRMAARGIPSSYFADIPGNFLSPQLDRFVRYGDATVKDFPWELNFYTQSIFLLDRFYFIPHIFSSEINVYRHRQSGEVLALHHEGANVRKDGQFDGVNGVFDPTGSFTTQWVEHNGEITANRINPLGFIESKPTTIKVDEWELVLQPGDRMLALHIPSGPGYTTERLQSSMKLALSFYTTYFPEQQLRGFWSESWLYDGRLSLCLDEKKSNIVSVQRQFYNYPVAGGDSMLHHELFGDRNADPLTFEPKTSLQRAVIEQYKAGARFHTTGMFVLSEELERIGNDPYLNGKDIADFLKIMTITF